MQLFKIVMGIDYKKWLLKYKLQHVFLWACIGLFLFISEYDKEYSLQLYIGQSLLMPLVSCIPFYTSAYYFVPHYLYPKKYTKLILLLIAFIIVSAVLQTIFVRFVLHIVDSSLSVIPAKDSIIHILNVAIWNNILCVFIGGGLKIISDRFRIEKKLKETEKEKISTELNFLRNQVNPHFLFNVMNTIYFQIDKKNTAARESVEKLSEMLRYQLYECNADRIEVKKEVEYIKNYVAIQSLRMEQGSDVQFYVKGHVNGEVIAPLLILPLVENAFKHVSHFKDASENKIHIILEMQNGYFVAEASNSFDNTSRDKLLVNAGGLGLQNLKRRLQLIYPETHSLETHTEEKLFYTILKVKCHD